MLDSEKSTHDTGSNILRRDLIDKAVKFLLDDKVGRTSLDDRRQFLTNKGLTKEEVEAAIQTAVLQATTLKSDAKINYNNSSEASGSRSSSSTKSWRNFANIMVLAGGATYLTVHLVKNFIMPKFFGGYSKPDSQLQVLNDGISDVQNSLKFLVDSCQQTLSVVQKQQELSNQLLQQLASKDDRCIERALQDLKNEISVVKSLLLSRDQFPPVPLAKPIALPAWQLNRINRDSEDVCVFNSNGNSRHQAAGDVVETLDDEDDNESFSSKELDLAEKITPV